MGTTRQLSTGLIHFSIGALYEHNLPHPGLMELGGKVVVVRGHGGQVGVLTLLVGQVLVVEVDGVPSRDDVVHDDASQRVGEDGHLAPVGLEALVALAKSFVEIVHLWLHAFNDLCKWIMNK